MHRRLGAGMALAGWLTVAAAGLPARAVASEVPQAAPAAVNRALGTVTAIQGNVVTLKTDAGASVNVTVQDSTRLVRIEPGQKTLQGATPVHLADLQTGDRILAAGAQPAGGAGLLASSVILMKHTDILQRQQQEQEDWQKRGVGGLVKAVDPAASTVSLSTGAASAAKIVTIHISKSTVIRRYAPDSVKFSDAKPGTLDQIQPGDQLEARGARSAEGADLTAEEVVSGSFRNIAGTISSVDADANQINVLDLKTKQPVVVKFTAESQIRALPQMMAYMIAARLKGGTAGAPGAAPGGGASPAGGWAGRPAGAGGAGSPGGAGGWRGANGAPGAAGGPPSFQRMLSRLPPAKVADLQKGGAVMIVATEGATPGAVTAITLLSGVEPILTAAPAGSSASILSPWSLSAPSGEDQGQGQGPTQ